MIHSKHSIDPVIRDLNNYLQDAMNHDIRAEHLHATAESEFNRLNYIEMIAYQDNFDDLETLFEFVMSGKPDEAKSALNSFMETVKEVFIENRVKELEQEEEEERAEDQRFELYYLNTEWC